MAAKYHFRLITREGVKYDGQIVYARLHAPDGYFGVMADHAPLIAALSPGEMVITEREGGVPLYYAAASGVVEIRDNEVAALVESAERADEINVLRASEAAARARQRLAARERAIDQDRALAALQRALARLQVASRSAGRGSAPR